MSDPVSQSGGSVAVNPSADFGFDLEALEFLAEHPEAFVPAGRTQRFIVGDRQPFLASINGQEVEAVGVWSEVRLNRVSLLRQESPRTGEAYDAITGSFNPVRAKFSIIVKTQGGAEDEIPLSDFLRAQVNRKRSDKAKFTVERFNDLLNGMGLRFDGNMVLLWQHLGAHPGKAGELLDLMRSAGAEDTTSSLPEPGRIQKVLEFPERGRGLEVVSFELGMRVDRSQSRTGQGFQDPVDAIITNFMRSVRMRREVDVLRKELEAKADKLDDDERAALDAEIATIARSARSWMNNIAGAQERIIYQEDQTLNHTGQWYGVSAPCGRFTLLVDGEERTIDLWKSPTDTTIGMDVEIPDNLMVDTVGDEGEEGESRAF